MAEALARYGRLRLRAVGSSMIPAIRPGDVLCIEHCPPAAARPGDVLLVRHGERVIAHRLIRTHWRDRDLLLVARGDALWRAEAPCSASMLLGRVVGIRRDGRAIAASRSMTPLQRCYGLLATEVVRGARAVRGWLPAWAAATLRTAIGSVRYSV